MGENAPVAAGSAAAATAAGLLLELLLLGLNGGYLRLAVAAADWRIRPLVSFGFGSGFGSGFESGFESWIRIRIQILDLNSDKKQAKTSFA